MTFSFPEGLAPENYPVAWLVGRWHGSGAVGYDGIEEQLVVQEIEVDHDGGPYLRWHATLWLADPGLSGPVANETPGLERYANLVKAQQWSTETGYIRTVPAEQAAGAPAPQTAELEVLLADPAGHLSLYVGRSQPARIELTTDAVVRSPSAAELSAGSWMLGLVQSDLMWARDIAAFGKPLAPYASGRLGRVE
ncbi:FABP family protein [Georgenia sp. Z1491]|uniref:FABP family protein n=1 Tax=Georgenia sp. Z1491 TaxID=3416707 RepID=UPI003CEFEF77